MIKIRRQNEKSQKARQESLELPGHRGAGGKYRSGAIRFLYESSCDLAAAASLMVAKYCQCVCHLCSHHQHVLVHNAVLLNTSERKESREGLRGR